MEPNPQIVIGFLSERIRQLEIDKAFLAAEVMELKNKKDVVSVKEREENGSRRKFS